MDNYKKQILQRVIDFYIEKADADKKTIKTVACLINDLEAINYTHSCKSDSELLKCEHKYGQLKNGTYTCFDCGHKEE